jgi:hypothetical protein
VQWHSNAPFGLQVSPKEEVDLECDIDVYLGCSGSTTDRRNAMTLLASNYEHDPIDVLVGDWMSEGNMTGRANAKTNGMLCT